MTDEQPTPATPTKPQDVQKRYPFTAFGVAAVVSYLVLLGAVWGEPGLRSLALLSTLFVAVGVLGNGVAASLLAGLVYEKTHDRPRESWRWVGSVAFSVLVTLGAVGVDVLVVKASSSRWLVLVLSIVTAVVFFILRTRALDGGSSTFQGVMETVLVSTGAGVGGLVVGGFVLLGAVGGWTADRVHHLAGPQLDVRTPEATWHLSGGYVALGDSYSSGEGQSPYEGVTRTTGCHRSLGSAYSVLLAASDWTMQPFSFRACSGAVVNDIYGVRQSVLPVAPQVPAGVVDPSVALVTLTIGGNDLNFAPILQRCFIDKDCLVHKAHWPDGSTGTPIALASWAPQQEDALNTKVLALLDHLKVSFPKARIIVLGYPYLFPPSTVSAGLGPSDCSIFLRRYSATERDWVDWQIIRADTMYEKDAAAEGLEFISPVAAWAGHEPCGLHGQYTSAEKLNLTAPGDAFDVDGSFHPNSSGQATFAGLVSCYLGSHPTAPERKTPTAQQMSAAAPGPSTPSGPPKDPGFADPCAKS